MKKEGTEHVMKQESLDENCKDVYVRPRIVTYTSEEIIEQVGPALTCSGAPTI